MNTPHASPSEARNAPRAGARYARARDLDLRGVASAFFVERTARMLSVALLVLLGARLYWAITHGGFGIWDLLALPIMIALQPFVEWLIHVFVLHHKPRQVFGVTWDYHAARHHRAHHRDPWDLRYVVIPLPALAVGAVVTPLVAWLLAPNFGVVLTIVTSSTTMTLAYEWVHFLVHTSYVPKHWWMKRLWRLHRLHHFKNERYWMGVTRHLGDVVLGTFPDKDAVPTSDTARTLGVEE
jgi:hypothetical protein